MANPSPPPSRKAALALVAFCLVAALAALLAWPRGGLPLVMATASVSAAPAPRRPPPAPVEARPKAGISGKVTEPGGAPARGAQVCAILDGAAQLPSQARAPRCAAAGADGAYSLVDLLPGVELRVSASSGDFAPASFVGERGEPWVRLGEGEQRAGVDFVLRGGVRIQGRVHDAMGGVIAGATVVAAPWMSPERAVVQSDEKGEFSAVVAPGRLSLTASAQGYASATVSGRAPEDFFSIHMLVGSTLVGRTVVAGTEKPVAGALVEAFAVEGDSQRRATKSDDEGHFRVEGLSPGRYRIEAVAEGRQGYSQRSTTLGLGETSQELKIEMDPAHVVEGRVLVKPSGQPCPRGHVTITDHDQSEYSTARIQPDGSVRMASVIPGNYEVEVECEGHLPPAKLPPLKVDRADPPPQVWQVERGEAIRITVVSDDKKPVAGAAVRVSSAEPEARGLQEGRTGADGAFLMTGLSPGKHTVSAHHQGEESDEAEVTVERGREASLEVALKSVSKSKGTIEGLVVDPDNKPVGNARVTLQGKEFEVLHSRDDGTFRTGALTPGEYRVRVEDEKPGEKQRMIKVEAARATKVTLTTSKREGVIAGRVVDSHGEPVTDAFLSWTAVGRGRSRGSAPVVTDTEGKFTISGLTAGSYNLRAMRRGAGEARAEQVATGTRDVTLRIALGASISGTLTTRRGAAVERFSLMVQAEKVNFVRRELFFHSPTFTLGDLPPGDYLVVAETPLGVAETKVSLAEGEARQGVALQLTGRGSIEGRLVPLEGGPLPAISLSLDSDSRGNVLKKFDHHQTDEGGRFKIDGVLAGKVRLSISADSPDILPLAIPIEVAEDQANALGDIPIARSRLGEDEAPGLLEFNLKSSIGDEGDISETFEVEGVFGAAAAAGLKPGDVIVSVDGHDVRGKRSYLYGPLSRVPAGRTLQLGLARGATVAVAAIKPQDVRDGPGGDHHEDGD